MTNPPPRLLAIVPHPDDESFFMGGTLAKYAARAHVRLVTVTDGGAGKRARLDPVAGWVAGEHAEERTELRGELSRSRRQEMLEAADELGVQEVVPLGFPEGLEHSAPFLRCAIRREIRSFDPQIVITLNEAGITRHPDHCWTALATYCAILDLADQSALSLQRFYTLSLPDARKRFDYWGEILSDPSQRVQIDVADVRRQSLAACHRHRSQAHWVSYLQSVGLLAPPTETFLLRWSRDATGSHPSDLLTAPPGKDSNVAALPVPLAARDYTSDQPELGQVIGQRFTHLQANSMRAVILASGHGKRMNNPALPKSMELVGEHPLLHYPKAALNEAFVDERPLVVTGPKGTVIRQAFPALEFVDQPAPLGTGHALMQARQPLRQSGVGHVCVLYGDMPLISADSIARLTARHLTGGSVLSLATIEVPDFQGDHLPYHRHGRIVRDGFGHIADIVEYADADDGQRALTELNPSIFCFDTNWLWPALERIEAGNSQNELYLTDLVKIAAADGVRIAEIAIPAIEGRGVNSRRDLALVEARLPRGSASHASGAMYRPVSRDAETMSRHRLAHAPKAAGSRTGS